jgi:putative RecB family exonuclease
VSLIVEVPAHLSWSQASNLIGSYCPSQYFYGRVLGKPERPSWASVGGSAVHAASEDWDRQYLAGEVILEEPNLRGMFEMSLDIEIKKTEESGFDKAEWRASGRASKEWPDKEDERWWRANGPAMLARWANWRLGTGWEIAMLTNSDGVEVPGIEIPFNIELGGVPIRGFVDRVFEKDGEFLGIDLKSGSMEPKTAGQLGTYRAGVLAEYGVDTRWGGFWMARTGQSGSLHDLTQWTPERLDFTYAEARAVQMRGAFMHRPSNMCSSCPFRDYCPEVGGVKAAETPQPWTITEVRIAAPRT